MNGDIRNPAKRAYVPPVLVVFGAVQDLTLSSLTNNMNDKGSGSRTMT
jgi:hypothetical protein